MIKTLLFCLATSFSLVAQEAPACKLTPPKGWQPISSEQLSPHVKLGFVGKGKSSFSPSLNVALETVAVSLESYVETVKKIHQADKKNVWRDLGKIQTASGEARLTAIDTTTESGPVRLMQMMLVKEGIAYVLTAAALKEEFGPLYKDFQDAFQSFAINPTP